MDAAQFFDRMAQELTEEPGELTMSSRLEDLVGWDSMSMLGVIAMIDAECNCVLSADDLAKCKTVGDVYNAIR
jgi:acyl carrier protein